MTIDVNALGVMQNNRFIRLFLALLAIGFLASCGSTTPTPAADHPYTNVITLTDADDLADYLPAAPTTPVAITQPALDITSDLADNAKNNTIPSVLPRLSPAGTSLPEPDNVLSGGIAKKRSHSPRTGSF